jgi:hypothetical protein
MWAGPEKGVARPARRAHGEPPPGRGGAGGAAAAGDGGRGHVVLYLYGDSYYYTLHTNSLRSKARPEESFTKEESDRRTTPADQPDLSGGCAARYGSVGASSVAFVHICVLI